MSEPTYRVVKWAAGYDLGAFDCGEAAYNDWLINRSAASVQSGVCAVYLLLEEVDDHARVVGYYAISPTQLVRDALPGKLVRGWPQTLPAWRLGKLAVHAGLRGDKHAQWGRQLLRDALETIVRVADAGGGKVIVVDADNDGLLDFYSRNGFKSTGVDGDLSLYMKVSTARRALRGGRAMDVKPPHTQRSPSGEPHPREAVEDADGEEGKPARR